MGSAIANLVPLSVGIAVNPIPIILVVLLLHSSRAHANGLTFLGSWLLGLTFLGAITLTLTDAAESTAGDKSSTVDAVLRLLVGLLLLFFAAQKWGKRPQEGEEAELPKWMASIDAFSPIKTLGVSLAFTIANPKHIALTVAAMIAIAEAGVTTGTTIALLSVFVAFSSLGVAIPVIYFLVGGEGAKTTLGKWRDWLGANNAVILAVLFLVFGVLLVSKGIGKLIG